MLCFGFLIGAVTAIIFVGIGICFGRKEEGTESERKHITGTSDNKGGSKDVRVLSDRCTDNVPDVRLRNRSRGGDERDDKRMVEQALTVLEYFRVGACRYELEAIDWLEEKLKTKEVHLMYDGELGFNPWQE